MSAIKIILKDLVRFRISAEAKDIEKALDLSLSAFNMVPHITYFAFGEDDENIIQIQDLLVSYATYVLLISSSLVERGKEHSYFDNGINYTYPNVGIHLLSVADRIWNYWHQQVTELKQSESFIEDFIEE